MTVLLLTDVDITQTNIDIILAIILLLLNQQAPRSAWSQQLGFIAHL
jgi:hypothetical protein